MGVVDNVEDVAPFPTWPLSFAPTLQMDPGERRTMLSADPAAMPTTPVTLGSWTGISETFPVPFPSPPSELSPHVQTVPSVSSAVLPLLVADTAAMFRIPGVWIGVEAGVAPIVPFPNSP